MPRAAPRAAPRPAPRADRPSPSRTPRGTNPQTPTRSCSMNVKKLAVLAAGIALGEFAWTQFIGEQVSKFAPDDAGFGLNDVLRYATYAGGVLLLQELL